MPKFRLVYFNMKGRAEPARWILAFAEQQYQDERLDKEKSWPARKSETPYGKLPVLYVDGEPICQSVAICRYLGELFDLAPKDPWTAAIGNEIVDATHDILTPAAKILYAKMAGNPDEAKALFKEFSEGLLKSTLTEFERKLKGKKWFCGEKITWVDLFVACYCYAISQQYEEPFKSFPDVKAHYEKIITLPQIQKWIKDRPDTTL